MTRTVGILLAVAIVAGACSLAESSTQTSTTSPQTATPAAAAQAGPIVLEFDLPEEFTSTPPGSVNAVTGFRVGYFRAKASRPVHTTDVLRDAVAVQGRTARITLTRDGIPADLESDVIRVQTLTGERASRWSEAVPLDGTTVSPEGSRAQSRRPPRGLTPADIEPYAALSQALRKALGSDASLEAELQQFRRVDELALAVVISRDYDIPFTRLSQTMAGPPRLAPRRALIRLRSNVNGASAMRKARADARVLVEKK